jgi:hypothetical protein
MKKSLFAVLMVASGLVSAVEFGVVAGGVSGANAGGIAGVTIGQSFDKISLTAGFARGWEQNSTSDRTTFVAGYDVAKIAGVTITPKIGYAYLNNSSTSPSNSAPSASAGIFGVGVSLPITKKIAATADYAYQANRNSSNIANVMTAGLKYSF